MKHLFLIWLALVCCAFCFGQPPLPAVDAGDFFGVNPLVDNSKPSAQPFIQPEVFQSRPFVVGEWWPSWPHTIGSFLIATNPAGPWTVAYEFQVPLISSGGMIFYTNDYSQPALFVKAGVRLGEL